MSSVEKKIDGLDLECIKFTLVTKSKWSLEKADKVEAKYKGFLKTSYRNPEAMCMPDEETDAFWHAHILDTKKYAKDCDNTFGYFVHHFPYFGALPEEKAEAKQAFETTKKLFKETVGYEMSQAASGEICGSSHCKACHIKVGNSAPERQRPNRHDTARMI